jgi:molybdenum cofactor synthesis domain-containing protein
MFRKLLSLDEAKSRIEQAFSPKSLGVEEVPLLKAVGQVLAENVASPIDVPPFNRSTVDGFAVRASDTFAAEEHSPVVLKLAGRVDVGDVSDTSVKKGNTLEIVTGAPLPNGADAVVMVENTSETNGDIFAYKAVTKGENVMKMGSDIRKGETVIRRGTILSSRELGVLAALGLSFVRVFRQPRVAIVSTGAEIVEPGKPLPPGKIYDINTYTLTAAVLESGAEPIGFGIVRDDSESLRNRLREAVDSADVVLTSGGVSVGPKDIVPKIIGEIGKPGLVVHGIAVKPGKPVAVAVVKDKLIFSLPGHPTSSLLMFHLLVRPILFRMAGREERPCAKVKAITTEKLFPARGRRTFITVTLSRGEESQWLASPVPTGQSGAITTLAKADGYLELKETQQFVEAGEEVTVFLFKTLWD